MGLAGPVHVVLEMEPTAGTIRGRLSVADAAPVGFYGWLELIDRLDRAAPATREAPAVAAHHTKGV
jgi:hypothetical protein